MAQKTKKVDGKMKENVAEAMIVKTSKGPISVRGRKFEGFVIRKFDKRVTIKFERVNYIRKYERYLKTYSKMHAYLPENLKDSINIGDYIQIVECRPLSKIIHFVVVKKIRDAEVKQEINMEGKKK